MTSELMRDFSVGAAGLSIISAFYYYSYTPMQLPAGLLYDRFGPRRVLTVAILICTAGAFFFCATNSIAMASAGRFFMGIGSAFSFIGALLLVSRWFPPQYFALIAGIVQLMSSLGAICGQIPIAAAVNSLGWRHTLIWVSIFGLVLAVVVWLVVKDHPPGAAVEGTHYEKGELQRLRAVLGKSQSWYIGIYSFAAWGPVVVFAALWGIPYLAQRYGISTTMASTALSMIWLGVGVGSPLFGWLSDLIRRRCIPLAFCSLLGVISGVGVLYLPHISFAWMYVFLFMFGLAASGQSLAFALVKDNNLANVVGTAIGFNNMMVVAGGAIFQPLAGILLHAHWAGHYLNGAPVYSTQDYVAAMIVIPFCGILGLIMSLFFLRETYCDDVVKQAAAKESRLGFCRQ